MNWLWENNHILIKYSFFHGTIMEDIIKCLVGYIISPEMSRWIILPAAGWVPMKANVFLTNCTISVLNFVRAGRVRAANCRLLDMRNANNSGKENWVKWVSARTCKWGKWVVDRNVKDETNQAVFLHIIQVVFNENLTQLLPAIRLLHRNWGRKKPRCHVRTNLSHILWIWSG